MIEQQQNRLILTFPTPDSATTFAAFLKTLFSLPLDPATSSPLSESFQETRPAEALAPIEDSQVPEPFYPQRSRRTVLTEDRQEALYNQRQQGQTQHQRLLRAQTTMRDGVLPFSKPGEVPRPSGQPSPRIKAQQEGTFADGLPQAAALRSAVPTDLLNSVGPAMPTEPARKPSRLRPVASSPVSPRP